LRLTTASAGPGAATSLRRGQARCHTAKCRAAFSRPSISARSAFDEFIATATSPTQAAHREELRRARAGCARGARRHGREIVALRQLRGSVERGGGSRALDRARGSEQAFRARALWRFEAALAALAPGSGGTCRDVATNERREAVELYLGSVASLRVATWSSSRRSIRSSSPTCGPRSSAVRAPRPHCRPRRRHAAPKNIGAFRVVREIGRGGMGVVLEAIEEPLGRRFALKILRRSSFPSLAARARFRREAELVVAARFTPA